jgi:putative glycosyltransferase (TIGR04372 family)
VSSAVTHIAGKTFRKLLSWSRVPLALVIVFAMRCLRPWLLIRLNPLLSSRIGHYGANTELYLCERDAGINVPARRHVDLCYNADIPTANAQLELMWGRCMKMWPSRLMTVIFRLNQLVPGGLLHEVGNNSQHDRDIHGLLERLPAHLAFTPEEELRGEAGLRAIGIPLGARFVCLIARDDAYLTTVLSRDWTYHEYRNADIQNYVAAAEALADLDYYVIRMGAIVKAPLESRHPKIIDYAANGMRSDFMDVYLGARCRFCISCGTGFDAIPIIFRRPIAYVNMVPAGYFFTFLKDALGLFKKHWSVQEARWLSLREIFDRGAGFAMSTDAYDRIGVRLIENSPEEIRELVLEMAARLSGTWQAEPCDEALQARFWQIYPLDARDAYDHKPLHGMARARYGAHFLRNNPDWLR